ncbi:MAG: arsenosugar biosynthesis radical SAM protein ArsS [Gemmatimonadota bacterium]|nr:arsenosugar biosynthesis radical SAM protein ArsS [Gemmatimonadota bacterium]
MIALDLLPFGHSLMQHGVALTRTPLEILQVNTGKLCNQACLHCHVEAGPKRTELMDRRTMDRVLDLIESAPSIHTVDITGGAPELNPHFRDFVIGARARGRTVIDRCNLTVLFEPGQQEIAEFLAEHQVRIVASLPCYTQGNVDRQRGGGVFDKSIRALQCFNSLGYGQPDSGLLLDLVYNPLGAYLPGSQAGLERDYKRELHAGFGISFNRLLTITNMPIKRFLHDLEREGKLEAYMQLLIDNFNPQATQGVMCRSLVSVGWDGVLYDCDFNQMLELDIGRQRRTIWDVDTLAEIQNLPIATAEHCYGCTAGAGSSCGGAVA